MKKYTFLSLLLVSAIMAHAQDLTFDYSDATALDSFVHLLSKSSGWVVIYSHFSSPEHALSSTVITFSEQPRSSTKTKRKTNY